MGIRDSPNTSVRTPFPAIWASLPSAVRLIFNLPQDVYKRQVLKSQFGLNYTTGFNSTFVPKWSEADRKVDINELTVRQDNRDVYKRQSFATQK